MTMLQPQPATAEPLEMGPTFTAADELVLRTPEELEGASAKVLLRSGSGENGDGPHHIVGRYRGLCIDGLNRCARIELEDGGLVAVRLTEIAGVELRSAFEVSTLPAFQRHGTSPALPAHRGITCAPINESIAESRAALGDFLDRFSSRPKVHDQNVINEVHNRFHGTRFNFDRIDPELGAIELAIPKVRPSSLRFETVAVCHIPCRGEMISIPRSDHETLALLKRAAHALHGNEMEVDYSNWLAETLSSDSWATRDFFELRIYAQAIHPAVTEALGRCAQTLGGRGELVVADLFGGDGTFVRDLGGYLARRVGGGTDIRTLVVEGNAHCAETARAKLQSDSRASVVHADLSSAEAVHAALKMRPDLVSIIGGLTRQVVTKSQAETVASAVFDRLADGGYAVLSGLTPLMLNRADFERIGFQVCNMSLPPHVVKEGLPENHFWLPEQLYVLRK